MRHLFLLGTITPKDQLPMGFTLNLISYIQHKIGFQWVNHPWIKSSCTKELIEFKEKYGLK
jgi:hypothetical protein